MNFISNLLLGVLKAVNPKARAIDAALTAVRAVEADVLSQIDGSTEFSDEEKPVAKRAIELIVNRIESRISSL